MTQTYRKLWAKNLLMWSDLTLGSSFKVKRWSIGFRELSFWWMQFASVLRYARSSLILVLLDIVTLDLLYLRVHAIKVE